MLVTLREILPDAKKNRYAVGLFNTVDLEMAKGVLAAAEEARSPVIIGSAEVLLPYTGLEELASFLVPLAKKATVPVVLHLDHGLTVDCVQKAIDLGFDAKEELEELDKAAPAGAAEQPKKKKSFLGRLFEK